MRILVHDDVEVDAQTGVSAAEAPGDHPLLLQAHASDADGPVRFRNVWVQMLLIVSAPLLGASVPVRFMIRPVR